MNCYNNEYFNTLNLNDSFAIIELCERAIAGFLYIISEVRRRCPTERVHAQQNRIEQVRNNRRCGNNRRCNNNANRNNFNRNNVNRNVRRRNIESEMENNIIIPNILRANEAQRQSIFDFVLQAQSDEDSQD